MCVLKKRPAAAILRTALITSPKGFSAFKCDVGNWIFSELGIFEKLFGIFRIFLDFFGILRGIFLEDFLGGFSWKEFFVYIVKVS